MRQVEIKQHERVDDLHRNGYMLIQDPEKFCFGVDAVLLSGFAEVKAEEVVLDLGTGTGVIPILLAAKTNGKAFIGVDIQKESVEMARRSVLLNELENKIQIHEADIKTLTEHYKLSSFDVITSNPPYMNSGGGLVNEYSPRAIARHELLCTLEDVISQTSKLLRPGGRFYMIHRPHRLTDIMTLLRQYKLEPKRIRFIHSYVNKEPSMVLIEAIRGGKPMLKVESPLIIYKQDGKYTDEIIKIYYE
jgi:tRNA1Val (adenine37-N6)-methyltransferase